MNRSTKDLIDDYLYSITATQDFSDNQPFTAAAISAQLHVSRSLPANILMNWPRKERLSKSVRDLFISFIVKRWKKSIQANFRKNDFLRFRRK